MSFELYEQCQKEISTYSTDNLLESTDIWSLNTTLSKLKNPPEDKAAKANFYSAIVTQINTLKTTYEKKLKTINLQPSNSHASIKKRLEPFQKNVHNISQNIANELLVNLIDKISMLINYYKEHGKLKVENEYPYDPLPDEDEKQESEEEISPTSIATNEDNNETITTEDDEKDNNNISRTFEDDASEDDIKENCAPRASSM